MAENPKKKFLYHAHTTALAGTLRKPFSEHIETQAGSALSVTGGVSSSRVEKFRHRDMFSCDAAYTTAVGHSENGLHTTLVTATVEYLNILNMVTADRVVTRIASRHKLDGTEEPSFLTVGSYIENLKIAGQPVQFDYDGDLMSNWDRFTPAHSGAASKPHAKPYSSMVGASIIYNITAPAGLKVENSRIDFPEFGSIYLGELYIWPNRRKLTMIRVALGCSHEGDVTICDGDSNGDIFPP